MFADFSSGYYVGRLYVEPHGGDTALMQREQHERVNEQLYATDAGIERLDHPLVMKLENSHFPVHGDDGIPGNTLAVPHGVVESTTIDPLPSLREVLLAKAERAAQLLDLTGDHPVDPAGDLSFDPRT